MRYLPAIDIWALGDAVRRGQIKLQSGQWVRLGPEGRLSRFERVTSTGTIRAYHHPDASNRYLQSVHARDR
jgi:hypothetical protein